MNILILNWRDIKNPLSGGAEQITQKYAEYWNDKGHNVFWIANRFRGSLPSEYINGILIQRIGPPLGRNTVLNLFFYPIFLFHVMYIAHLYEKEKKINLVIDEIHGLPFFTPFFISVRKVLLVCEVAGEIWDRMWPFPISFVGKYLEKLIYQLYGKTEMWAISENTKEDILKLNPKADVAILPLGIDIVKRKKYPKTSYPSAIFLARLVPMKGIEIALKATILIVKKLPTFKLFVIGRGTKSYEDELKRLVERFGIEENIVFLGYVSEEEKYKYLSQSHFLFHPSYKEGFGLTVLEAGLVGTPAIVKKGSSLDELVVNGKDGYIIQSSEEIAELFIQTAGKNELRSLSIEAEQKSKGFAWNKKLKESEQITSL